MITQSEVEKAMVEAREAMEAADQAERVLGRAATVILPMIWILKILQGAL